MKKKGPINWKKIQEAIFVSARMGTNEFKRGLSEAKNQISKYQLIQKRKNLFAELGRSLYEVNQDNLPIEIKNFINTTELVEIINEIKELDSMITAINTRKNV